MVKIEIVIIGDGKLKSMMSSEFVRIQKKLPNLNVQFLGEVNDPALITRYHQSSEIVIGHGRGLLEGLLTGKPGILLGFCGEGSVLVNDSNVDEISHFNFLDVT